MSDCSSKEGIQSRIGSYEGLYELLKERQGLGRDKDDEGNRKEVYGGLTSFAILGRFVTDNYGQVSRVNRTIFTDADRVAMPAVMSYDEFLEFFETQVKPRLEKNDRWIGAQEGHEGGKAALILAPPHIKCRKCGNGWDLETCHEIESMQDFENIDLAPFLGKTLREVAEAVKLRSDAECSLMHARVQNPQWVTTTKQYVKSLKVKKARHPGPAYLEGWRDEHSKTDPITWDYVIKPGDSTTIFRYHFFHGPCFKELTQDQSAAAELEMIESFKKAFEQAGFDDVEIARTATLPDYLLDWLADTLENQGRDRVNRDELNAGFKYWSIKTKQGSLGIAEMEYPFLDLTDSGVSLAEFVLEEGGQVPPGNPPLIMFTGEQAQLFKLWQLLMKKNKS